MLDSLTPEYSQIGAVWLPLPHLLNLLPVQVDWFYRTGASGVAISVLAFSLACYAIAHLVLRVTGSRIAAAIAVAMFALDPDVLYLQSTPMTEPLLFGLVLLSICLVYDWVEVQDRAKAPYHRGAHDEARAYAGSPAGLSAEARSAKEEARARAGLPAEARAEQRARAKAGWCLVLACLTRYEAWLVTAAVLVLERRCAVAPRLCALRCAEGSGGPCHLSGPGHRRVFLPQLVHNRRLVRNGRIFRSRQRRDRQSLEGVHGRRVRHATAHRHAIHTVALAGVLAVLARGLRRAEHAASLVVLALVALIALPAYAFFSGHPFRMRYMVAPSVGAAVFAGMAIGLLRNPWRLAAAAATAVWLVATVKPVDAQAPMVQEAQWDVPFSLGRRNVTACLMREYRGERILASMGSLAHYMQELSHAGINIRDFVHEGTLPYWQEAIEAPARTRGLDSD